MPLSCPQSYKWRKDRLENCSKSPSFDTAAGEGRRTRRRQNIKQASNGNRWCSKRIRQERKKSKWPHRPNEKLVEISFLLWSSWGKIETGEKERRGSRKREKSGIEEKQLAEEGKKCDKPHRSNKKLLEISYIPNLLPLRRERKEKEEAREKRKARNGIEEEQSTEEEKMYLTLGIEWNTGRKISPNLQLLWIKDKKGEGGGYRIEESKHWHRRQAIDRRRKYVQNLRDQMKHWSKSLS